MLETWLKPKNLFLVILLVGAILRFWGLGSAELFHDEGAYAFRIIGYLDFLSNDSQTTPVQWFRDGVLPDWTKLSFHDHPPLYFLTTYIFASIFGDNLSALRLPSALAGFFSIYLLYLILRRVTKDDYAGLLGAAILAVNHMHIWISRSLIMESLLIAFILMAIYAFILFLEDRRYWYFLGGSLGLVALTKYTGVFLLPVFALYAAIWRRDIWRSPQLYASIILAAIMLLPVIIYNLNLYKAVGHFDLQLSYLFGQETPEWQASFGKIQHPFSVLPNTLIDMYSILFLLLALGGLVYAIWVLKEGRMPLLALFVFCAIFITLTLLATGAAQRFISLYVVALVPLAAVFLMFLVRQLPVDWSKIALVIFLIYELAFSVYGIFIIFPDFGVRKLDNFFDEAFQGLASRDIPQSPNPHLDAVIKKYLATLSPADKSILVIYDENISLPVRLWLYTRRTFYHGITTLSVRLFKTFLNSQGPEAISDYDLYFVKATDNTLLNPYFSTNDGANFESFIVNQLGFEPVEIIRGHSDLPMFTVYKFRT
jgi:4-amino-4-deoxy-L-arabinose transferase-like glycosyltransferase